MPSPRFQANRGCASTQTLNRPTSICKCVPNRASSRWMQRSPRRKRIPRWERACSRMASPRLQANRGCASTQTLNRPTSICRCMPSRASSTLVAAVSHRESHSKVGASLLANGITSVPGEPRLCIDSDFEPAYQHLQMRAQSRQFNAGRSGLPQGNAFQGGSEPAREWHHLGYRRTEVVHQLRL